MINRNSGSFNVKTPLSWRLSIVASLGTPSERVEHDMLGSFITNSFRSLVDRDESFILVRSCENGRKLTHTNETYAGRLDSRNNRTGSKK